MVRLEDRQKEIGMARELGRSNGGASGPVQEDVHDRECSKLKESIDKAEREIVRLTLVAEKEKRESITMHARIKKLQEQLATLKATPIVEPDSPEEQMRRSQSEGDLIFALAASGGGTGSYSSTPPISVSPFQRPSLTRSPDAENKSPNISPNISPIGDATKALSKHEALLAVKQDELARVQSRARDESTRYSGLRVREEALRKEVEEEMSKRLRANQDMILGIAKKEKEIQRLTIVAERDKRVGMSVRDQITTQRKTLEVFAKTLTDKRPKLNKIISSCNEIVVPTPASMSPTTSTGSACNTPTSPSPLSLTPVSPTRMPFASSSSSKAAPLSPLQEEMNKLMQESSHKDEELSRVRAIAGIEATNVAALKGMSEEVKMAIADELQSLDDQIEVKLRQVRTKQDAIKKVAARAEVERVKACKLQEELDALAKVFSEERNSGVEIKKSEYIPDKAYFSEFKELSELVPVAEIATHNPATVADKTGLQLDVDPLTLIQSPRIKQISITDSKDVLSLKLRDIATLQQQITRLDEELVRVKNLKEAEIARKRLLAEKLRDLMEEVDHLRYLKSSHGREVSRTF